MTSPRERRVLVTGASRGLGRAVAAALSANGHRVVATARQPDDLAGIDAEMHLALDVTDPAHVDAVMAACGPVDVLINNAATTVVGPTTTVSVEHVRSVLEVNTLGAVAVSQAVLPGMRARGTGLIVQVSSVAARAAPPLQGAYAASKAALARLSEALRWELGPLGIDICTVQVGALQTDLVTNAPVVTDDQFAPVVRQWQDRHADHADRATPPDEAAQVIAELLDDRHPPATTTIGPLPQRLVNHLPRRPLQTLMSTGLDW